MGSSCKKYIKDKENGLGSLLDAILICIFSLLPTKVVARTSVLCKRWRNLWTDVTAVEVELPLSNQSQSLYSIMIHLTSPTLRRFSVITNHLHTFCEARSFKFVCDWKVEEIQRCTFFDFTTVNLPKLKLLCFSFGGGKSFDSIAMLIKSCLLLETLEMTLDSSLNSPRISIVAPNLKSLSLIMVNNIDKHQVIIDSPKLTYLCFVDRGALIKFVTDPTELDSAYIYLTHLSFLRTRGMDANDFVRELS
ncbi:hypothetical protein RDABS01_007922, partial [Bienertia sinuspersici]